jgi:hypothetical protein
MATIGQIGEYVESKEEFECYIERIEQFFEAIFKSLKASK